MNTKEQLKKIIDQLEFSEDQFDDESIDDKIIVNAILIVKSFEFGSDGEKRAHIHIIRDSNMDFITNRGLIEEVRDMSRD